MRIPGSKYFVETAGCDTSDAPKCERLACKLKLFFVIGPCLLMWAIAFAQVNKPLIEGNIPDYEDVALTEFLFDNDGIGIFASDGNLSKAERSIQETAHAKTLCASFVGRGAADVEVDSQPSQRAQWHNTTLVYRVAQAHGLPIKQTFPLTPSPFGPVQHYEFTKVVCKAKWKRAPRL